MPFSHKHFYDFHEEISVMEVEDSEYHNLPFLSFSHRTC